MATAEGGNRQRVVQVTNDLEAYHRLVELQKQMIELDHKRERALRECKLLREQIAKAIAARLHSEPSLQRRLQSAVWRLNQFNRKKTLPC